MLTFVCLEDTRIYLVKIGPLNGFSAPVTTSYTYSFLGY